MNSASRHLPDKPRLNGAEKQLACPGFFPGFRHIVQYPFELCSAEVRVYQKTRLLSYHVSAAFPGELVAKAGCTAALPDNGVVHRHTGFFVPDHSSFSLIGYSDGFDIFVCEAYFEQRLLGHSHLGRPYFHGVMFHPAFAGVYLSKLFLSKAYYIPVFVVNDAS